MLPSSPNRDGNEIIVPADISPYEIEPEDDIRANINENEIIVPADIGPHEMSKPLTTTCQMYSFNQFIRTFN